MSESENIDIGTGTQARDWVFTINNPIQTDSELYEYLKKLVNVKYFCFCREMGNGTEQNPQGTLHMQGYIEFSMPKRFSTMKGYFSVDNIGVNAHVDNRKAKTKREARDYVFKIGKFADKADTHVGQVNEFGDFVDNGQRSDLTDIKDDIQNGADDIDLFDAHGASYMRNYKFFEKYRQDLLKKKFGKIRRLDLEVIYIHGTTGAGKTRYVRDKYGDDKVFAMTEYGERGAGERFDGYNGEDVIIFEEFRSDIKMKKMLPYLDVYPCSLPARYNSKTACYTKVYIISNWSLDRQYKNIQENSPGDWNAFLRRIHKVYDFDISEDVPVMIGTKDNPITNDRLKCKLLKISDEEAKKLPF